ncbi:MAG: PKD domain-containing protein [Halobacteriota archaeon]
MNLHVDKTVLFAGVLILLLGATGTVAAADELSATGTETGWEVTNVETGATYELPADADLDEAGLPAGEYVAVKRVERDGEVEEVERRFQIEESGTLTPSAPTASSDRSVGVATPETGEGSVSGDGTTTIWVGVTNRSDSTPVENAAVRVEVERPDYTTETFNLTTDGDGKAPLTYDLAGKPDGRYAVSVEETQSGDTGYASFIAGQRTDLFPGIDSDVETGNTLPMALRVTEEFHPVSGAQETIEITHPNGTTSTRTVTTDGDGYATFDFTPESAGRHRFDVENGEGDLCCGVVAGDAVAEVTTNGRRYSADVLGGQTAHITGHLMDDGAPMANQEVTLRIENDTRDTVANLTTTTDQFGAFDEEWQTPSVSEGEFDVEVVLPSGESVIQNGGGVDVVSPDANEPAPEFEVTAESDASGLAPGQTVPVTVAVTDNGTPVSGATVDAVGLLESDVPVDSASGVTNDSGEATLQVTVPESVVTPASLEIETSASTDEQHASDSAYVDVEQYEVDYDLTRWGGVAPGETQTYTYEATNRSTGAPASGLPVTLSGEYSGYRFGVFFTGSTTTNASGEASITAPVPDDVRGTIHYRDDAPGLGGGYPYVRVQAFDVSVSGLDDEYAPGEQVTLSYTADTEEAVGAVVTVFKWDGQGVEEPVLLSERFGPGESQTITIPSTESEVNYFDVQVQAVTASGETSTTRDVIRVDEQETGNTPPTAAFDYSPANPTTGEPVTLDASASTDSDGQLTSYEWDVDGDGQTDLTGETASHTFETNGSHTVTLTVGDDAGATDSVTKTVAVTASETPFEAPVGGGEGPPTDPDGDGTFEDVDGDGTATFDDAIVLAFVNGGSLSDEQREALDIDGDGDVDFDDAISLAFSV